MPLQAHLPRPSGPTEPEVRVLVVDDDPGIRRVLSAAVARMRFEAVTASDGAEAISLATEMRFDIVLTDLQMTTPGTEVARSMRERFGPAVWIAIVTGADDDATHAACLAAGADEVMAKPFMAAELRRCLLAGANAARPYVEARRAGQA